jgi:hypothetical protein
MLMKRTIFGLATILVVFVAIFAVFALRPVAKVRAGYSGCSNKTLKGNYGLVASGFKGGLPGATEIYLPANFSMLVNFDGNGHFSASKLNAFVAGNPSSHNPASFTGGLYTVLSDCTCTLNTGYLDTFEATITAYGIVVDTGGDELVGSAYASDNLNITGTFDAKKIAEGRWIFWL